MGKQRALTRTESAMVFLGFPRVRKNFCGRRLEALLVLGKLCLSLLQPSCELEDRGASVCRPTTSNICDGARVRVVAALCRHAVVSRCTNMAYQHTLSHSSPVCITALCIEQHATPRDQFLP